jgi:pimeloyl-ACP methyl ester carboxylesterase
MPPVIRRGFTEIDEGQVHYRTAGEAGQGVPLVMIHASPGSAKLLEPLIAAFGRRRHVIACDTLGNGDSCLPRGGTPSIGYFADAHRRALAAMGIERFDLYGTHTGAAIACELAIAAPDRVRRLVLDGLSLYPPDQRDDMLAHYAPGVTLDQNGSQLAWIWNFVRDAYLFWPWYRRDAAHRRPLGLPSAEELHDKVVEVLKAARSYHLSYNAAIGYDKTPRLPLVTVPTLLACARGDMLFEYFDQVAALMPRARKLATQGFSNPAAFAETLAAFEAFLDGA